jgi:hypothetical protein
MDTDDSQGANPAQHRLVGQCDATTAETSGEGGEILKHNSNIGDAGGDEDDDEDEKPVISRNSKSVTLVSSKQQEKKTGWKKISESPSLMGDKFKVNKKSSLKRLPMGNVPPSSSKNSSMIHSSEMNAATVGSAPTQTKVSRKKKLSKLSGEMLLNSESQAYPHLYSQPSPPRLSAAQAAVDEMFRQALQEQVGTCLVSRLLSFHPSNYLLHYT